MLQFDSFKGRAIIFGIVAFVLILVFGLFLNGSAITSGQFVLYGSLVSLVAGIIAEPIAAKVKERRMNPSEFIGASTLGTLTVGMVIALISYACGIII